MSNHDAPLMPKAVAVWLVENTALTFDQIARFCKLHLQEVQGIADGEVAVGITGSNPIETGQVTREDIEACCKDPNRIPELLISQKVLSKFRSKRKTYTPVAHRRNKPDAIAWIIKFHPDISDIQIAKLIGTTKATINNIKNKTHWNFSNIKPRDPVSLCLCSQADLDDVIREAEIIADKEKRLKKIHENLLQKVKENN